MASPVQDALQHYLPRLYGYALSLTGERAAAQDLLQDCAVKALAAAAVPTTDAALRAWLFRILRNAWIDNYRRDRYEPLIEPPEIPAEGPEFWSHDERLINAIAVRQGLSRLPTAYRDIVALVDGAGFSYAEAAALLDLPVGTVMSRLSRARRALLAVIGESNVHALRVKGRTET